MMQKTYLKVHRPAMYSLYMLEDRLVEHLNLVDDEAQERMDIWVRQMMERQGITEELKARDRMKWVRAVNNIRNFGTFSHTTILGGETNSGYPFSGLGFSICKVLSYKILRQYLHY